MPRRSLAAALALAAAAGCAATGGREDDLPPNPLVYPASAERDGEPPVGARIAAGVVTAAVAGVADGLWSKALGESDGERGERRARRKERKERKAAEAKRRAYRQERGLDRDVPIRWVRPADAP